MTGPHGAPDDSDADSAPPPAQFSAVPLFPLPNVVLFPRVVLPLHVFEERYKAMTADALGGKRLVAMALLRPGWERDYYHQPQIEPVVCVGQILTHERLPDGRYNFLLQGVARARVARELPAGSPYRLAELEPLREMSVPEEDLGAERERLARVFRPALLGSTPVGRQSRRLLDSGEVSTPELADLVAFSYVEDVALKQSLLAECDVRRRVRRTLDALEGAQAALQVAFHVAGEGDASLN